MAKVEIVDTGYYGRTIADVECQGADAAAYMVDNGMAVVYDKYSKGYDWLYEYQNDAKKKRKGLWADPHQINPWEWRKRKRKRTK